MNHKIKLVLAVAVVVLAGLFQTTAKAAKPTKATEAQPPAAPAIELGAPFTDNAILQREMLVPVWGWSKPGEKVTVEFAGQKKTATAGADGKWLIKLDALKASATPAEMVVTESSGAKRVLKNILVGEVWMASGQSNMQWPVAKCDAGKLLKDLEAKGEKPPIRECAVKNYFACLHPIEHATGEWNDGDYGEYSAIAFSFALKLYQELGVPIGILNCSFSQTSIEAWTPRTGFAAGTNEYTRSVYQKIRETDPAAPEHKAAWENFYAELEATLKENAELVKAGGTAKSIPTKTPGNLNDNRDASWLFNARLHPMIPYAIRGCIWNQGYANIGGGIKYYENLHSLIGGWRQCWERPELPVYFHQFYCPGGHDAANAQPPEVSPIAEMRLGALLARDIPNTGMACQIDVEGAIHYRNKTVSGQRLALHALKNQYGQAIVADSPIFKSYAVSGDQVIVEFENAAGGLVVAETGFNALGKTPAATGFANPKEIPNGDDQVKHFYLAGEDRVWHPATIKIQGEKIIVTAPGVKSPRGISYGTGGIGFTPNIYNRALLPLPPFIYYDNKLVTSKTWPDDPIKIAGVKPDPNAAGKLEEYRKMPLLSSQFLNDAVLQADQPVTIWGSAVHDWGYEAKGKAEIKFSFNGIEKTIPVTPGMREWAVTVPAMPASTAPKTLKVSFSIDGELAHERIATNIVIGDVWYVAAGSGLPKLEPGEKSSAPVRMMTRKSKGSTASRPRRFSVSVSTTPDNRFASFWEDASGVAGALGNQLGRQTGRPVGVILMQSTKEKGTPDAALNTWIPAQFLNQAPSLMKDYEGMASVTPGNPAYDANVRDYIAQWKKYWGEYIPEMIRTKSVPDHAAWGKYPTLAESISTTASETYNVLVHSFTPASFKGIIFLCHQDMFTADQGAHYGEQLSALANSWKQLFGGADPHFFYALPSPALAPKISQPQGIKGKSTGIEISSWTEKEALLKVFAQVAGEK